MKQLIRLVADPDTLVAEDALQVRTSAPAWREDQSRSLEAEIVSQGRENDAARRLINIPGVGPLIVPALVTLTPPPAGGAATSLYGRRSPLDST